MREEPKIIKELREEERIGLFSSSSELEQILPGEANDEMQEEIYSSMDTSEDLDLEGNDDELLFEDADEEARLILDEVSDLVLFLDLKGKILDINKTGLEFSGFERKEVIGKYFWLIPGVFSKKNIPKYMKVFKDALKGKKTKDFTASLKNKNGKKHVMAFSVFPKKVNGKIKHITVVSKDITERKRSEEKISKTNTFLRNVLNSSLSCIYVKDKEGKYLLANKAIADLYQTNPEEMIGKKDKDFSDRAILKPTEAEFFEDIDKNAIDTGEKQIVPCESFTYDDGTRHYFYTTKIPIKYSDDTDCVLGVSTDITRVVETEEDLREKEEIFRRIVETVPSMLLITDKEGSPLYISPNSKQLTGYTPEEFYKEIKWWAHPDDIQEAKRRFKNTFKNHNSDSFTYKAIKKNGDVWYASSSWMPLKNQKGGFDGIVMQTIDITDKTKAEEKLKESEEKFKQYFDKSPYGIFVADEKGNYIEVNKEACKTTGYTKEELLKMNLLDLLSKDDEKEAQNSFKNLKDKGEITIEMPFIKKDGGKKFWVVSAVKISDDCLVGFTKDITNEKKKERKLKQSEERYRTLLESSKDSVYILDYDWKHVLVNDAATKFTGKPKEELIGEKLQEVFPGVEKTPFFKTFEKVMKTRQFGSVLNVYEFEDGRKGYYEVNITPVPEGILCISRDITKRKEAEEEIRKSEEKYRELFNNALVGIDIHNSDGSVFAVNKTAENIFGLSEEDLKKKDLSFWKGKLIKPDGAPMESKDFPLSIVAETKKPSEGIIVGLKMSEKDEPRWFLHSARPLLDKNGEIDKVVTSFVEITDKKLTEKKYRNLFEKMDQGVVYQNSDGKIISANPAAEKILGLSFDQMIERTSMDPRWKAVDENKNELPGEKHPAMMVLKTGKKITNFIQGIYNPKISDYVWIIVNSMPQFKNGSDKPYQVFSTFLDITDRVKAEEKLKKREKLLNFAIKQTTVPVIIAKAPDAEIIHYNKAAYELLQKKPKDVKDIPLEKHREFWPTFHPDGRPYDIDDLPLTKAVKRGIITKDEKIVVKKDGKEHWISASAAPLVNKEGKVLAGIVVFPEITEQKESEKKKEHLAEEKQFLSNSLIRISKSKNVDEVCRDIGEELHKHCGPSIVAVNLYNKDENVFLNRAIYGLEDSGKIEKILGKELTKMKVKVPKEIHEEVKKGTILKPKEGLYELLFATLPKPVCNTVERAMKIKDIFVVPLYHNKKLFGTLMILTKKEGKNIRSSVLETYGYQCSVVIQRLMAEGELKENEEKYRNMIELSPDGIAISDLKGTVTSVNKSFLDITGFNKEEIVGKHVSRLPTISFKDFPNYMKVYKDILLGKQKEPFVFRWKHKNGELRWGECRYTIMKKEGKKVGIQVVLRDITEQRKHDEEIRKFKTISDKAQYGVNLNKLDGTTVYVNDAFAKMHGYKKEELIGKPHDILHIEEEISSVIKDSREKLKKGEHVFVEETHKKKDGSLIPVQVNASAIPDNDGKPMLIAGIVSNLSKQKELTQKLKESENLFRTLIEQSASGVYIHDPVKNKLFYANPLIRKILKIKEEDIEKTNLFEYLHPDDAKLIKERTRKRLAGEKIDPSVEIRIYPPGKKEMWVKAYTTFIKYKGVTAALASVIDITESKEARLKEKEHLEELQRYKDATIGREMRVIELKREVNKICKEQGLSLKYKDIENEIKKYEEEP